MSVEVRNRAGWTESYAAHSGYGEGREHGAGSAPRSPLESLPRPVMSLATLVPIALQVSVFALVFALGLNAGRGEAAWALRHPRALARAAVAMYLVMPLVAVALAGLFALKPAVKIALLALALSPVPPLLPRKQQRAEGDASKAIGLLVAAGLAAIVVAPLGLRLLAALLDVDVAFPTARILLLIAFTIVLPLGGGMLLRRMAPTIARSASGPIARVGAVLLVVGLIAILVTTAPGMWSLVGGGTLLAFATFLVVGLAVGHLLAGGRELDRTVLALSTASRHPGFALTIAAAMASADARAEAGLVAPAILLYLVLGGVASAIYLALRKRSAKEA